MSNDSPPGACTLVSTTAERPDWQARLGRHVRARRRELGLSQLVIAAAGGPSTATMYLIESDQAPALQRGTKQRLDAALQWAIGSVESVIKGEATRPVHPDPAIVENLTKHFERQVERLAVHFEKQSADVRLFGQDMPVHGGFASDGIPDYVQRARQLEHLGRSAIASSPIGNLIEAAADLDRYLRSAPPEATNG